MDKPKDRVKGFYQKAVAVYDGKEWCVLSGPGIDAMRLGEYSPTAALAWDSARQRIGA